jgi:hypothetical protein
MHPSDKPEGERIAKLLARGESPAGAKSSE